MPGFVGLKPHANPKDTGSSEAHWLIRNALLIRKTPAVGLSCYLGQRLARWVKNSGKEMAAASAPWISVSRRGAQGGDGEGHGDAVVGAGVDGGAVERLAAGDVEAVLVLGELGAHGA